MGPKLENNLRESSLRGRSKWHIILGLRFKFSTLPGECTAKAPPDREDPQLRGGIKNFASEIGRSGVPLADTPAKPISLRKWFSPRILRSIFFQPRLPQFQLDV